MYVHNIIIEVKPDDTTFTNALKYMTVLQVIGHCPYNTIHITCNKQPNEPGMCIFVLRMFTILK